ncbi:MAG TPA: zinc ribbon domain-containing protein [Ktedonobacteraceae bacterium]|nr:zinc ribbon domain-containing protein [Ktedonobacteraceae bacterium]
MFCSNCGKHVQDGVHFCDNCGAQLQAPGGVSYQQPAPTPMPTASRGNRRSSKAQDPYEPQIKQIKLQLRQLKLDLKQINTGMGKVRSQYNQSAAFVPRGLLRHGYKEIEDVRLWGPQQKKQQLQQEIIQLEQQLLGLQQQQAQWQAQQG